MTDLKELTPHDLLARVENRNRRFKFASVIFATILTVGLAVLVVIGLNTLQKVNNQLSQQKRLLDSQQQILAQIQKSSNQRTHQLNDLQNHIDCIVTLLQHADRSTLTITSLQDCQISRNGQVSSQNYSVGSTPPQSNNSGAVPKQNTTGGGVSNTTKPSGTPSTPVSPGSTLDRVPVLGRVFRAIGL